MIVVSDTTPLNYLLLIEAIEILPKLFQQVHVPRSVIAELSQVKAPEIVKQWAANPPAWLKVSDPSQRLPSTFSLDQGEADAISLAKELHIQDILIDERRGRKIAQLEGITPLPRLAVLERAAIDNLIDLPTTLHALEKTTIRIPQDRIDAVLLRDHVRKQNKR